MALPENPILRLARRAAQEGWDDRRASTELWSFILHTPLTGAEVLPAIGAMASPDLPFRVASWVERIIQVLTPPAAANEQLVRLHVMLATAWLERAQAGDWTGYDNALRHCELGGRRLPPDDAAQRTELHQIAEEAETEIVRIRRLLFARSEADLEGLLAEWPDMLAATVERGLQGMAEAAREEGHREKIATAEKALRRLAALRALHPPPPPLSTSARRMKANAPFLVQGYLHFTHGQQQYAQGAHDAALASYAEALSLYRSADYPLGIAHVLLATGEVHAFRKQMGQALAHYNEALALYKAQAHPPGQAGALLRIGQVYAFHGERDQALATYQEALALAREANDLQLEAHALRSLGAIHAFRREVEAALAHYEQALALYRRAGDPQGEANTLESMGDLQSTLGEGLVALATYDQALALYRQAEDRLGEANTLLSLGRTRHILGDDELALAGVAEALTIYRTLGEPVGIANALHTLGEIHRARSDHAEALAKYNEALAVYQQIADRLGEANTRLSIGEVHDFGKETEKALANYEAALSLYQALGDRLGEANARSAIGHIDDFRKDAASALTHYEAALALYRQAEDRLGEANTLLTSGHILHRLQERDTEALSRYRRALSLYAEMGLRLGEAHALRAIGEMHRAKGAQDQALAWHHQALALYRLLKHPLGEANVLLDAGREHEFLGHREEALASYHQAITLYQGLQDRIGLLRAHWTLGLFHRSQGQNKDAYQAFRDALTALEAMRGLQQGEAGRRAISSLVPLLYRDMVRVCLDLGEQAEAWHWAESGKGRTFLDLLGRDVRPRLGGSAQAAQLYDDWHALEQEILRLEDELHSRGDNGQGGPFRREVPSPAWLAQQSARLAAKRQEEARLRQQVLRLLDEGRELMHVSVPQPGRLALFLQALATRSGERPLLVEYFRLEADRYAVFLLPLWQTAWGQPLPLRVREIALETGSLQQVVALQENGVAAAHRLAMTTSQGATGIAALRSLVEQKTAERALLDVFASIPAAVGRAFVQPWAETLAELAPTALILVPHQLLHLLPLHAGLLQDGTPLIERYPLVYLSNAALARTLARRRRAKTPANGCLVLGPPDNDLLSARAEAEYVATHWGVHHEGQPYADDKMRVETLRQRRCQLWLAHLATHSAFDEADYLQSFIAFHQERLTLLDILSDERLDLHGMRLFYLSSCESGLAWTGEGDELQGLVWSLLYAGANGVLATLWPAHDRAAYLLAKSFYDHLRPGVSFMQAYQQAVAALRRRSDYANPYFWAPFALFGDGWQGIPSALAR